MTETVRTYDPYAGISYRHVPLPLPREAADDVVVPIDPSQRPPVPPRR